MGRQPFQPGAARGTVHGLRLVGDVFGKGSAAFKPVSQPFNQPCGALRARRYRCGLVGGRCLLSRTVTRELGFKVSQRAFIVFILGNTHAFATEVGAEEIGLCSQPPRHSDRFGQGGIRGKNVLTWAHYFALDHDTLVLLVVRECCADRTVGAHQVAVLGLMLALLRQRKFADTRT